MLLDIITENSDKERVYKIKPVHDWSSHAADAMRTSATGLNEIKFNNKGSDKLMSIQTTRYYNENTRSYSTYH